MKRPFFMSMSMKNLIGHFKNSILSVFFTSFFMMLLSFLDNRFLELSLLILFLLPPLLFLDFVLWVLFYDQKTGKL